MNSLVTKISTFMFFGLFSVVGFTDTPCLQVEGEYSLKEVDSGETVLLHIEQKGCQQVNVVYDYGKNGKSARVMMFNGRPVIYVDNLEYSYIENYEVNADQIKTHAIEIDKIKNEEVHTQSQIYLDQNKNWVEEGKSYLKDHEAEASHHKVIYTRLK